MLLAPGPRMAIKRMKHENSDSPSRMKSRGWLVVCLAGKHTKALQGTLGKSWGMELNARNHLRPCLQQMLVPKYVIAAPTLLLYMSSTTVMTNISNWLTVCLCILYMICSVFMVSPYTVNIYYCTLRFARPAMLVIFVLFIPPEKEEGKDLR